jgi:ABC-type transport system involved in cytochrome c biogenesis ATPase subunit
MRLRRLFIESFKNLRDFTIDFDQSSSVSVLVGRNGTGKSNILEALTLIFRDLDLGQVAPLTYELEYHCRGRLVQVQGHAGSRDYKIAIDGVIQTAKRALGEAGKDLRPDFVFGYYSGPSNRLEQHFVQHQDRFYRALVEGTENPLRRLFYARTVHSNFVLLAFFLEEDEEVRRLLRDQLGIESLDSVLFEMQQPGWNSRSGDARFWNARGTVQAFLGSLYELSLAPMRLERRVRAGARKMVRSEHLYLFISDLEAIKALRAAYTSNQEFFKALESTYISDLIFDVRIRVALRKADQPLTFRELSEGEQQLLLVLGLMRFTREEESLFLLDEPDTHLNPAWSAQYRRFLYQFGGLDERSHVVMATHDPLVVSALTKEEVRVLNRTGDGRVVALEPSEDPRGMGVSNLLTSDIYGLRAALDIDTLDKIERKRFLSVRDDLSPLEEVELANLAKELQHMGYLMESQDPDYAEYLQAKYSSSAFRDGGQDSPHENVVRRHQAAQRIVDEVLGGTEDVEV